MVWTGRTLVRLARIGACALVLSCAGALAFEETKQVSSPEPGVFGTFGRWVDETLAGVTSTARGSLDDAAGHAGDTAKDAAEAGAKIARIPFTSVVGGRQRCIAGSNSAPDCQAATDALCRERGFATGHSVDIQSAEKCPAEIWLSGRQARPGECTTETYVTRAVCQ